MAKKKAAKPRPRQSKNVLTEPVKLGGNDVTGHKPVVKGINNNYLAGAIILGIGGYYALSQGWFANISIPGLGSLSALFAPPVPVSAQVNSGAPVQQGSNALLTGSFNPQVPTAYYSVTNAQGQQVLNGTLGSPTSSFSQNLATSTLPIGTYNVTISDMPIPGASAPTASTGGTGLGGGMGFTTTGFTLNQAAAPGEGSAGPESFTSTG